jgi:hypothetical protein
MLREAGLFARRGKAQDPERGCGSIRNWESDTLVLLNIPENPLRRGKERRHQRPR